MIVAALYVGRRGVYQGLDGVEPWDEGRDARLYDGPWPVVAHPPCARWGRYWSGGPSATVRRKLGDDGGCFEAALSAVRQWGGVLEHPEGSHAWRAFGLNIPPHDGGWVNADFDGGWTCCVEQGHYGHKARKKSWLYAVGVELPSLRWGRSSATIRLDDGYHSAAERRRAVRTGVCQRLSHRQRAETPIEFRDLLIGIARTTHMNLPAESPRSGRDYRGAALRGQARAMGFPAWRGHAALRLYLPGRDPKRGRGLCEVI